MRKIILLIAIMISAAFSALAQNSNMEIVFDFEKCKYWTSATGNYEVGIGVLPESASGLHQVLGEAQGRALRRVPGCCKPICQRQVSIRR